MCKLAFVRNKTIFLDALFAILIVFLHALSFWSGARAVVLFCVSVTVLPYTLLSRLKPIPLLHSFATVSCALLIMSIFIDPGSWPMHLTCLIYAALSRRILYQRIELQRQVDFVPTGYVVSPVKRVLDLALAITLMPLWLPLMLFLVGVNAFLLRGKPLYIQEREGLNGVPFRILKFRTMGVSPSIWYLFQRKTGLDELPQILNIIRGDMSFVGPRPELLELARMIPESARLRAACRPGLTGLWQISPYRSEPIYLHTELDVFYYCSATPIMDLSVIFLTPFFLITKKV